MCLERDFGKIEEVMTLSSLDSFTSRLSFSPKGESRAFLQGLFGLQTESADGNKTAVIVRKYSNEMHSRVFDISPRQNSTKFRFSLKQPGTI